MGHEQSILVNIIVKLAHATIVIRRLPCSARFSHSLMPGWAATRCRICKVLISVGKTQDINRQMSLIDHDPSRIPGNPTEPTGPRLRRLIHHNFIVAFTEEVMHERTPKILGLRSSSIKSLIGTTLEQGLCDFSIQSKQTAWLEYHG